MKKVSLADILLKETDDFIFINKPAYISTLEDRKKDFSILSIAREVHPNAIVGHRLDKETSGVMVIAKSEDSYKHLTLQFERREVYKEYHAVVEGIHHFQEDMIELPIHILSSKGRVSINHDRGKPSATIVSTLKNFRNHALVQCEPVTGRMHQIRVHLSRNNAPLVSDVAYGGSFIYLSQLKRKFNLKKDTDEQPLIKRVALHAYSLGIKDRNDQPILVQADYPKDMRALLRQLDKNT